MKIITLTILATAAMALSSVSVWALAPESSADDSDEATVAAKQSDTKTSPEGLELPEWITPTGATFSAGKTVHVDGRLGHAVLAANRESESFLFLDLSATAEDIANTPAPVNLAITFDRSRSMQGQRLDNALAAARGMIRRLRDGDTVSVVAYNTSSEVLVQPTVIDARSRDDILFGLRGIEARGHTCISCGLETSMELLRRRSGAVNRILLLSDGEANTGIRKPEGFRSLAERARGMDTTISSIGVDVDYNERIMFAVAQASNGRHYFVEDPAGLPRIFDDELQSLVSTVAADAQVEIDLAPGVEIAQVFDRSFTRDGNRVIVPFGTFAAGDSKSLLMRLRLGGGQEGRRPVADVKLRYRDLTTGDQGECDGKLVAQLTDKASDVSELDAVVEARLARAETNLALGEASDLFSRGDVVGARRTIRESRGRIKARKKSASGRAKPADKAKLDRNFDDPFAALDEAEGSFSEAQQEAPAAPQQSRAGKRAIKGNTANDSLLGL